MKNLFILISVLLLTGCSLIEEPGIPCESRTDDIMLSFRMIAANVLTRADDEGHVEAGGELKSIEDGIDLNDLGIFIFAKMENSEGPEKLLMKITDLGASADPQMSIIGSPGAYTINMVFQRAHLHEILGVEELNPKNSERVQLRLLILANCISDGTNPGGKWSKLSGNTYDEVIGQANDRQWHYALSYLYNNNITADDAFSIWTNRKKSIPMFGTNTFLVTQEGLYNSGPYDRIYLGEIDMLRALAKVRVVDNISGKDALGYPKIVSATIAGTQSSVCQLPYNALTYTNGQQVHEANIADPEFSFNQNPIIYRLGTIPSAWDMTPADQRKGTTRIGYLPEQIIDKINNETPQFRITIAFGLHPDGSEILEEYTVPMSGYMGLSFQFGDYILRNHIYTLSVNSVKSSEIDLNIAVKQWRNINYEYEY